MRFIESIKNFFKPSRAAFSEFCKDIYLDCIGYIDSVRKILPRGDFYMKRMVIKFYINVRYIPEMLEDYHKVRQDTRENAIRRVEEINSNIEDRAYLRSIGIELYNLNRDSHIIVPSDFRHFRKFDEIRFGYYVKYNNFLDKHILRRRRVPMV